MEGTDNTVLSARLWELGIWAEYGRTQRRDGGTSTDLDLLRQQYERPLDYRRAGISVGRRLGERWILHLEAGCRLTVDELDIRTLQQDSVLLDPVQVGVIERLDGRMEPIWGTARVGETSSLYRRHYLRYRAAELGLWAGYRHPLGRRWTFGVRGGVRTTLWQSATGTTFGDAQNLRVRGALEQQAYRQAGSWALGGAVQCGYRLLPRLTLQLDGLAERGLTNQRLTGNAAEYRSRYGLRLGLVYR